MKYDLLLYYYHVFIDAVFSDQYTGTVEGEARLVGRMTYFEIVQQGKCLDEERLEVMEEQMDVVKKM